MTLTLVKPAITFPANSPVKGESFPLATTSSKGRSQIILTQKNESEEKSCLKQGAQKVAHVFAGIASVFTPRNSFIATVQGAITSVAPVVIYNLSPLFMYDLFIHGSIITGAAYGVPASVSQAAAIAYMALNGIPQMPMVAAIGLGILTGVVTTVALNILFSTGAQAWHLMRGHQEPKEAS